MLPFAAIGDCSWQSGFMERVCTSASFCLITFTVLRTCTAHCISRRLYTVARIDRDELSTCTHRRRQTATLIGSERGLARALMLFSASTCRRMSCHARAQRSTFQYYTVESLRRSTSIVRTYVLHCFWLTQK